MRPLLLLVSSLLILVFSKAQAQISIAFKSPEDASNHLLNQFVTDTMSRLPFKIQQSIKRPIIVEFVTFKDTPHILPMCPSINDDAKNFKGQRWGTTSIPIFRNAYQIQLHIDLKEEILRGEAASTQYLCGHKNFYRLAKAALIHEIAYIYDRLALKTEQEADFSDSCRYYGEPPHGNYDNCNVAREYDRTISSRTSFKEASIWKLNGLGIPKIKNSALFRSPDPNEVTNIEQFFAVNLEYYILDPEYACRRPALNNYFEQHFKQLAFARNACSLYTKVILDSRDEQSGRRIIADIDAKRVYQIHYLQAAKGDALMSRFGHSMYRLIICAPGRNEVGPDCLNDVDYHIVISFRANVHDVITSYIKGVFGGYNSQMFLYSISDIIREYTEGELRDLYSLPLQISDEKKQNFIYRTLEQHWAYVGKYYFLTNNCATESEDLLKSVLADPYVTQNPLVDSDLSPIGFYNTLSELKFTNKELLADQRSALQKGYLIQSKRQRYDRAYDVITQSGLQIESWKTFISDLTPEQRKTLYLEAKEIILQENKNTGLKKVRELAANIGTLEKYALFKIIERIQKEAVKQFEAIRTGESTVDEENIAIKDIVNSLYHDQHNISAFLAKGGYGIPLLSEVLKLKEQSLPVFDYKKYLQEHFKDLYQELKAAEENFKFYADEASQITF